MISHRQINYGSFLRFKVCVSLVSRLSADSLGTRLGLCVCNYCIINPRPEGYGSRFVCHSLIHSLILSPGTAFTSTPQLRHERDRYVKIF